MNAIAFVLDGLYYGVSDFEFAAYSMVYFCCSLFILINPYCLVFCSNIILYL